MRLALLALVAPLLAVPLLAPASLACAPQSIHHYVGPGGFGAEAAGQSYGLATVWVMDANTSDCDGDGALEELDFDGDFELGLGGAAFGWGAWADEPLCGWGYNVHGPNVIVTDVVVAHVAFAIGENDQDGPTLVVDENSDEVACETSGAITPETDDDDCLAFFVTRGRTCGTGGGDGLFWVFLTVQASGSGFTIDSPTAGTIVAYPDP